MRPFLFLFVFFLKACEAPDVQHYFKFDNKSNFEVCYYIGESFPDTLINPTMPTLKIVQPNSSIKEADWGSWEERYNQIEGEKFSVFLFHADTIQKYSWEIVRDGYKILKRYDLSLEDLKQCDYTITYP